MRSLAVVAAFFVMLETAAAGPEDDGWHALFDGSSTDAWRGYRQADFPAKGWVVEDGALRHVAKAGGGDIVSRRQYRNFELVLQFKVGPKANSGIMYRVGESEGASYMTGPEFQVLDDAGHGEVNALHAVGSLYGLYPAEGKKPRPAGEWNDARIVVNGDRVEHWLNGTKVVTADLMSDDWNARVAKTKFAPWKKFGRVARGHICLQDHGDDVWYRNIRIRELPPEPARRGAVIPLLGDTLEGWSAHLRGEAKRDDVWSIAGGVLSCKGTPAGYLYTQKKYANFVLKLEWRWPGQPGNSGVLFRMIGEHKVWPRSIEAQLHSGNAGDFWNIGDFPMKTDAARAKGRNTKKTHANEKPVGEWNAYEIIVDGSWVQLRVNGEVLNEAWDCEEFAGHICLQSEGAPIEFRNIRLIPLQPAGR
jgi:hypothetical protein